MPTIFIRDFPDDLHHKAKVQAALERITLKEMFARALRDYLRRAGVPEIDDDIREAEFSPETIVIAPATAAISPSRKEGEIDSKVEVIRMHAEKMKALKK